MPVSSATLLQDRRGSVSMLLVITGLILAGSYGVASSGKSPPPGAPYVPRECPLDSLSLDSLSPKEIVNLGLAPTPPIGIRQAVRDADSIADIPEFHDCQRFIEPRAAGVLEYGALYAIYRSNDLETLQDRLKPAVAMTSMVGAVIYSVEGYYAPLGLAPGFNCLYLFHTTSGGALSAKVVQYGRRGNDCADTVAAGTPTGLPEKALQVSLQNPLNAVGGDFAPAVARWEWDTRNKKQYIGIKWGSTWASVGEAPLVPATLIATPGGSDEQKATAALNGWFDEQRLAVGDPSVLSSVRGAVFPNHGLDAYQETDFGRAWKPVAYVSLTPITPAGNADIAVYTTRMNLTRANYGYWGAVPMNRIFLCKGNWADCPHGTATEPICTKWPADIPVLTGAQRWWAMVVSNAPGGGGGAGGAGASKYFCIVRMDHSNRKDKAGNPLHIPGAVRWRWVASDETIWIRCGEGCCEVDQ